MSTVTWLWILLAVAVATLVFRLAEGYREVAALGIAPEGLDFQAIDGRSTHLVILLVNPAHRTRDHVRTLAEIARLLSSDDLRESLVQCEREDQVVEIIRAAEAPVA